MSGGGGTNTTTQTNQIPAWVNSAAQQNYGVAQGLASSQYPTYQGQLIQGFTPQQTQAFGATEQAAGAYQPYLNAATNQTSQASQPISGQTIAGYMNPYIQQSLAPQLLQNQIQQGQNQLGINSQATQAGAFGDAQQGVESALNNYYAGQAQQGIEAQGFNTGYNNALSAAQQQQTTGLAGANQLAGLGTQAQNQGITGATALYNSGLQQQNLGQSQLGSAYQQFLNQVQWPYQQLNTLESGLTQSPYSTVSTTSQPTAGSAASNLGAFGAIAGGLGSLGGQQGLAGLLSL